MKNAPSQSKSPSTSQTDSAPGRQQAREAGQASQEQQGMSNNASSLNPTIEAEQQGGPAQTSDRQQQADTDSGSTAGKNRQPSPSRDQGHSPSGSSHADGSSKESNKRSDNNSPPQTGESH